MDNLDAQNAENTIGNTVSKASENEENSTEIQASEEH